MKSLISAILLIGLLTGGIGSISRMNEYANIGAVAYARGEYIESVAAYEYLLEDLNVQDDQVRLNLGHAYFKVGEIQKARQQYTLLAEHSSRHNRAVALLQLGIISAQSKKYKLALSHFRQALVVEPGNEAARYNYELIKKLLDQRPDLAGKDEEAATPPPAEQEEQLARDKQNQLPPDNDEESLQPKKKPDSSGDQEDEVDTEEEEENEEGEQQKPGGEQNQEDGGSRNKPENKERQETSGNEPGDTQGMNPDNNFDKNRPERSRSSDPLPEAEQRAQTRNSRLQQMNINPEKARLMLEAMRSAEQQYIQQLPKKATRKPDPSKPNW
ncbi:tetratricopeptide repeat protein [uncultured Pontibacter sp.]|uniref:tetratricopeptide repeat protein n=1 Tax=uncultured Pontibacter sp. TaxID=453356 RepID=UPI00263430ED|nr:tetratricopeptide repeat protein [uncultured Pontibacter sp.]